MQPLPDWVSNGAIVSLQGGQDEIDDKYNYLKEHSVPLAGVWMQDWVGLG
jgi:sulfoquinovosidase